MAATATNDKKFEIPPGMKGPLIFSGAFHLAVVVVAIVGLPYFKAPPEPMTNSIPVEILPIGEMTTTNKPPVKAPPPKEEKPVEAKPIEKPPAPPKVEAVEPPKEPVKPVEKPKPKPKPVAPPPPEALKEPEPPPKPPEEKPKPEEKPVEPEEQQSFDSLLKNLQDSQPDVADETLPEAKDAAPAPSPLAAFSDQLTMSEADALRAQLSRCWSIQAGARYAENLVVEVRLTVSRERRVMSATIVDQWRYGQDTFFRAAADSAIRAVNSPQCETLNLPPEKYDTWKDIVVVFDPREML